MSQQTTSFLFKTQKLIQHVKTGPKFSLFKDAEVLEELKSVPFYFKWLESLGPIDFELFHGFYSKNFQEVASKKVLSAFKKEEAESKFIQVWTPIVINLKQKMEKKQKEKQNQPLLILVNGCQGSGKTTFSEIIGEILKSEGKKGIQVSIDDYYFDFKTRETLKGANPFLKFRGPPGTHDTQLMKENFKRILEGKETEVPRFEKGLHGGSGDRVKGTVVKEKLDFLIFEGYLNGFKPVSKEELKGVLEKMRDEEERKLGIWSNEELRKYEEVWELFDELIAIIPEDFHYVYEWREEAEAVSTPSICFF